MTTDADHEAVDFSTHDQVEWLTQGDRAADAAFRRLVAAGQPAQACNTLLGYLYRTERVRAHLILEDGPLFGTGEPLDLDVALQTVAIAHGVALREAMS